MESEKRGSSLFVPIVIISIGFLMSCFFAFRLLNSYRIPAPLLIKPSSVESLDTLGRALRKALFPLVHEGKLFSLDHRKGTDLPIHDLRETLKKNFNIVEPGLANFHINLSSIDLTLKHKETCYKNAAFSLKRKIKKWKEKYYFVVCKKDGKTFEVIFARKQKPHPSES